MQAVNNDEDDVDEDEYDDDDNGAPNGRIRGVVRTAANATQEERAGSDAQ